MEVKLYTRDLYVAAAKSWLLPTRLSHGAIMLSGSRYFPEMDNPEAEIYNAGLIPTVNMEGNKETEAFGSSDLPHHTTSYNGVEQWQEGETGNVRDKREAEGTECTIDILNNDCLMHIFSFLNIGQRIEIERVCKRWQAVGLNMWQCQKKLDFTPHFFRESDTTLCKLMVEIVLKRCGANLQSLNISQSRNPEHNSLLSFVARYCQNLRCLNLARLPVSSWDLMRLSKVSQNLRVLNLDGCAAFDQDLWFVFQRTRHLETLTLSRNSVLEGQCLTALAHTPLTVLVLNGCIKLQALYLVKGLHAMKSLSSLSLSECKKLTSSDVADIVAAVPSLQSLSMEGRFPSFNSTTLKVLGQLCDIISLNLQHNRAVNDEMLEVIARSCHKLEELNIAACSSLYWRYPSVTDTGLKYLAALPNLLDLYICYLESVSDGVLESIASKGKLRRLACRYCKSLTDVGCISVVTSCNELELFDFSGCDSVSDATVRAALHSVQLRTKDIKLKLIVDETRLSRHITVEENSLLELDWSMRSVQHLYSLLGDFVWY